MVRKYGAKPLLFRCFSRPLDKGADVFMRTKHGENALHLTVPRGTSEAVKLLLDSDVPVNAENSLKETPLHVVFPAFEHSI